MNVIVYGRKECGACHCTTTFLTDNDIEYTYVDADVDPVPADAGTALPYVVTAHGSWSGFRVDKLKALKVLHD